MIDVGFWEVAMIGIMALIILGPERLPKVARTAGMWIGKARSMMREVKADIKNEMDAAELSDLKSVGKDIREAGEAFKSQVEAVDKNVQSEASEMDTAIADALNKPAEQQTDAGSKSSTKSSKNIKTASKKSTAKNTAAKKTTRKKKTSKKKITKKTITKKTSGANKAKVKKTAELAATQPSTTDTNNI